MMQRISDIVPRLLAAFQQRTYLPTYQSARSMIGLDQSLLPRYRVICPWCFGAGGSRCVCRGAVLVCPRCRGARLVSHADEDRAFVPATPCPVCTDWFRRSPSERYTASGHARDFAFTVDRQAEIAAIARYLAEYPEVLDIVRALGVSVDDWTGTRGDM